MTTDTTGVALEPAARALLPVPIDEAEQAMAAYQELTRRLLKPTDWIGEPGAEGSFVKKSGWLTIANYYGISTEIAERELERDEDGKVIRAFYRVVATAPGGRHQDGGGACAINEPRFRSHDGRQKIEHDLPGTAETRARNRAIANLVGFGAVSAEEVDADVRAGSSNPAGLPDWALPVDDTEQFGDALRDVLVRGGCQDPATLATKLADATVDDCAGDLPSCVDRLSRRLQWALTPGSSPLGPPPEDLTGADFGLETDGAAASPDVPPDEGGQP
jgi:hypothetical protein